MPKKTFNDVIKKYFRGDSTKYFHSSDSLSILEGDTYLKYDRSSFSNRITLWFGGNDGEVAIKVCWTPEQLEKLIEALIY